MVTAGARSPAADIEGAKGMALDRRPVRGRRAVIARLARCSRSVRGNSSENEFDLAPKLPWIRPPRLFANSPTIRRPRPGLILTEPEPLSVTRQFTQEPVRFTLIVISPSRLSKQA